MKHLSLLLMVEIIYHGRGDGNSCYWWLVMMVVIIVTVEGAWCSVGYHNGDN